jgi:aspartyl-tRNA(Asn)/glutamyl-tRNA(Gln) amidotransferase subunit A
VADAASVLGVIAGHDPLDATSWRGDYPDIGAQLEAGVAGMRIGVVGTGRRGFRAEVTDGVPTDARPGSDAGAEIVEVSIPTCDVALSTYYLIAPAEASANLARFDGIRYGLRVARARPPRR